MKQLKLLIIAFAISVSTNAQKSLITSGGALHIEFVKDTTYLPVVTDTSQTKKYYHRQIIFFNQRLFVRDSLKNKWIEVQTAATPPPYQIKAL